MIETPHLFFKNFKREVMKVEFELNDSCDRRKFSIFFRLFAKAFLAGCDETIYDVKVDGEDFPAYED